VTLLPTSPERVPTSAAQHRQPVLLGLHLRAGAGLSTVVGRAEAAGARCLQVFTQSPRSWGRAPQPPERLLELRGRVEASPTVSVLLCHATYLINLAAPDHAVRTNSRRCLVANLAGATAVGAAGLVLHPGSHRGAGWETGGHRIVDGLRWSLDAPRGSCDILLENTAGGGDTMGRSFSELARLIEWAGFDERLGVCLDSQHLFAAGADFASAAAMDAVIAEFDATVGLRRLRAIHFNDSHVPFGSQRDRHASLGLGMIGAEALRCFVGHPRLQGLPVVIETPGRQGGDPGRADVDYARSLRGAGRRRYAA